MIGMLLGSFSSLLRDCRDGWGGVLGFYSPRSNTMDLAASLSSGVISSLSSLVRAGRCRSTTSLYPPVLIMPHLTEVQGLSCSQSTFSRGSLLRYRISLRSAILFFRRYSS